MTPPMGRVEYLSALEALQLSVPECARFFGVGRTTAYRWAQEENKYIPGPIAMWLRYMVRANIAPSQVQWILSKPVRRRRSES